MPSEFSAALCAAVDADLRSHLIRQDGQEDLAFALWTPSEGAMRLTALVHTLLLPEGGDRNVHGNASFQPQYFERACRAALRERCGVAFLHSHPFPGWQGMSADDVRAELKMCGAAAALTGLPLLGMTVGSDGTWSARIWEHVVGRTYDRRWCASVRIVAKRLRADFASVVLPTPRFRDAFRRSVNVWGKKAHANLARLRIGIVGLGSVGAVVAEALARMGLQRFVLIDFDRVKPHNLDRLLSATDRDIGRFKCEVAEDRMRAVATGTDLDVRPVPFSVVEEDGYRAALDCDVLFSCVDRPRPRAVLDHFAFAHMIPAIDGGIQVRFKRGRFSGVDWQLQTVGPGRACLECLGAYDPGDVSTEAAGKLDDPSYMQGLPSDHRLKRNENVFPFSANLASLEVLQLLALATGAAGVDDFGVQRFRYVPGILEQQTGATCRSGCDKAELTGQGDRYFTMIGEDPAAASSRKGTSPSPSP